MIRYVSPSSYDSMSVDQLKQSLIKQLCELETMVTRCLDQETYSMSWEGMGSGVFNRLNLVTSGRSPIAVSLNAVPEVDGKKLRCVDASMSCKLISGERCHFRIVDSNSGVVMPGSHLEITSHLPETIRFTLPWEQCKRLSGDIRLEPEIMPDDYGSKAVVWGFSATLVYGD